MSHFALSEPIHSHLSDLEWLLRFAARGMIEFDVDLAGCALIPATALPCLRIVARTLPRQRRSPSRALRLAARVSLALGVSLLLFAGLSLVLETRAAYEPGGTLSTLAPMEAVRVSTSLAVRGDRFAAWLGLTLMWALPIAALSEWFELRAGQPRRALVRHGPSIATAALFGWELMRSSGVGQRGVHNGFFGEIGVRCTAHANGPITSSSASPVAPRKHVSPRIATPSRASSA